MAIILLIINIMIWLIIIRSLLSWFDPQGRNQFSQILYTVTEPVLAPIRNLLGRNMGGFDLSPTIAVIVLVVIENILGGGRF